MARLPLAATAVAALAIAAPAAAVAHDGRHSGPAGGPGTGPVAAGQCSVDASLLGFTDALDKTTFAGTDVGGLSGLALTSGIGNGRGPETARAIVDDEGSAPARTYDVKIEANAGGLSAKVVGTTTLRRPNGTPYTGLDFDGEAMQALPDGTMLATSETEPSIRRFSAGGRELGQLPVPPRFRIAPAGQATANAAFEGLGLTPGDRTLFVSMEGPLSADGSTADREGRNRIIRYERDRRGGWKVAAQYGYLTDSGLGISEVQAVSEDELLVLERGFVAGVGNTVRVYEASLRGASDVSNEPTLARDGIHFVHKRLLVDLASCPPDGATSPEAQPNPLLDNVEAMAIGGSVGHGEHELDLLSDDNFSAGQVTRLYRLAVKLPAPPRRLDGPASAPRRGR